MPTWMSFANLLLGFDMLHTLSTPVWDAQGFVAVEALATQNDGETRRRMNRVATLDGGAVVNDAGFSEADRTIELKWVPGTADYEYLIERLVKFYPRINISARTGFYECAVESYRPGDDESTLRLLVVSKLSS